MTLKQTRYDSFSVGCTADVRRIHRRPRLECKHGGTAFGFDSFTGTDDPSFYENSQRLFIAKVTYRSFGSRRILTVTLHRYTFRQTKKPAD